MGWLLLLSGPGAALAAADGKRALVPNTQKALQFSVFLNGDIYFFRKEVEIVGFSGYLGILNEN